MALALVAIPTSAPVLGHGTGLCGAGQPGYIYLYQNGNFTGDQADACSSDVDWSDNVGSVANYNDRMSAFHGRDVEGDGQRLCVLFYANKDYNGDAYFSNLCVRYPNNEHSIESVTAGADPNQDHTIDGSFNDVASSHTITAPGACD